MNLTDSSYSKFALVQEMMDTVHIVKKFDVDQTKNVSKEIQDSGKVFLTGEGSSRLFPAKNAFVLLCAGWNLLVEIGLASGIDLDKPERARKVGNEFIG